MVQIKRIMQIEQIMKKFKSSIMVFAAALMGLCYTSCSDANEYEDTNTANPTWSADYENATHPESLANTTWLRGTGFKKNAFGEEIQGFVESLVFVSADSVEVKMSEGATSGTWKDESNTQKTPRYEYTYSNITGKFDILKSSKDDKGKVSKTSIFMGTAVSGTKEVITIVHFGDTPVQTYLEKQ